VNVYLVERKKLNENEESEETMNEETESEVEKNSNQEEDEKIDDKSSAKETSYQTHLILLNPVPSAKDYSFAMDKNEGLFQMYGLTDLITKSE